MTRARILLVAAAIAPLSLASCATIPRDAGLSEVRQSVAARTTGGVEWALDDARLRGMLQDDLTAEEAVAIGIANNPRLQVTLAELGIARADLIEASTISNPLLELELRLPGDPYRPYEVRLAQSLVDLIQLPRRRAIGRAAFDAARMRVSSEVLRFASDVRADYFDLVAAAAHARQSRTIFDAAQAAVEVALEQHKAGNITDLDLESEQASYEQAKLDLSRAERTLLLAREALARGMGLGDSAMEWRVPDRFPDLPEREPEVAQLEQLAAQQRLDLAIARREVEIAQRRVPAARLAALGEIELDVHYEREPGGEHTIGPGLQVPIPIFNTGRAARTRAEAEYLLARSELHALEAESSSRIRAARALLGEARARVEYYRDVLLPRRRRIVELTKLEHNAMLTGVFQLLQARQNEAQAESELVEAQHEFWSARGALDRVRQGIGDEDSLVPATGPGAGRRVTATRGGH